LGIGILNLLDAFFPAQAGQVNSGATTTSIPTVGKRYIPSAWKGGYIYFVNGAAQGQFATIIDNTETTFTVTGLTVAPGSGDVFVLYLGTQINANVIVSENVAQWGGTNLTGRDISLDLAKLDIALSILRDNLRDMFSPLSNYGSSIAAPLTVVLDTGPYGGRTTVEVWVKSNGAANFNVYGSRNGTDWRAVDTISLTAAGEVARGYQNAYRYIRVNTTAANNNEIEIVASR
jgi:hypothetical protein